jgi:nitrite reductase (NO-forming)
LFFNIKNENMKKSILVISAIALVFFGFKAAEEPVNSSVNESSVAILKQDIAKGKETYNKVCGACHQATGLGLKGAFPPLAGSDYLNKDANRAITTVLKGLNTEITVNGVKYKSVMPPQATLTDVEISNVLTYVYSSWGNSKKKVTPAMVKALRGK